jgi:hypothetical protein
MTTDLSNHGLDSIVLNIDARGGERMINALDVFLGRFVCYPNTHARTAHALWIVHAHLMERWDSTPRIAFLSAEPASGKSRALEVTSLLVPRPMQAVNMSSSALFRSMGSEDGLPTILFDEVDTIFGPKAKENEDIRGLLNAGHRRGQKAYRSVVRGTTVAVEGIEAFSALALAGLGWLPDTIMTRAVIIRMRRRRPDEKVDSFRYRLHESQGFAVRALIEQWAGNAEINWPELPTGIEDRDADVWESLIGIADAVGGDWPERARKAAVALVAEGKEREPSLGVRLLADLKTVFGDAEAMSSKAILDALHRLDEAPSNDLKGKPLNERGLAHRLRQYEVKPRTIRVGNSTPKGYAKADLHDAWARYLPPPPDRSATSATSATSPINQASDVADVTDNPSFVADNDVADVADGVAQDDTEKANHSNGVADVADVAGGTGALCDYCQEPGTPESPLLEAHMGGPAKMLHRACISKAKEGEIPPFLDRRKVALLVNGGNPDLRRSVVNQ